MENPLLVEIITFAPTAYYHCTHCEVAWHEVGVTRPIHEEQMNNSLPPDLIREYQVVSDWVKDIFRRYCDQVIIKVTDATSVEGFIKSLRYGVRHYPAVVVAGKKRFIGALQDATLEIARQLEQT